MELAAPMTPDQTFWTRRYHRFKLLREDGTSRRELDEAIERQLHT